MSSSKTSNNNSTYQRVVKGIKWGHVCKGLSTVLGTVNFTIFIIIIIIVLLFNQSQGWVHPVHWGLNEIIFINLLAQCLIIIITTLILMLDIYSVKSIVSQYLLVSLTFISFMTSSYEFAIDLKILTCISDGGIW